MRNNKIVNIRSLAIILVVLGHSIILYSSQWDLYTTIHSVPMLDNFKKVIDIIQMPLFFSISGFLFYYSINKRRSIYKFMKNKFFRLMIPYFCVAVVWMIPIRMLVGYKGYAGMSFKHIFMKSVLYGVDCGHLWFLPTLFLIFIEMYFISYIIIKLDANKFIDFVILLIFILLSNICFRIPNIIPFTSKSFEFIVWFYSGYLINKYEENLLILNKFKYIQIILLIVSFIYWWIYGGFISALVTKILMLLNIYILMPSKNNKYLELISNNSFGIYLFHSPLIYITFSYIPNVYPVFVVILNFIIFGGISLLITLFIKKTKFKFIIGE